MATLRTRAIVCAVRTHGEHGAIVRLLTPTNGLVAGYVRGARSSRLRPILIPGNIVAANFRSRTSDHLPGLDAELVTSRGPWLGEPLASAAIEWATALTASALQDRIQVPGAFRALGGLLDGICLSPSARGWAEALVGYEWLLLDRLGFGSETPILPANGRDSPGWPALFAALNRTGSGIEANLLEGRLAAPLAARAMLIDRMKRAVA